MGVNMKTKAGKQSLRPGLDSRLTVFSSSDFETLDLIFSMHFFDAPPNFRVNSETLESESTSVSESCFRGIRESDEATGVSFLEDS